MTIWILAVVLLASVAALGFRQGAIRVAFSFLGIVIGALLAAPLGHLLKPVLPAIGIKSPLLTWIVPPIFVFIVLLALFKFGGLITHKKIEVYYKYKAGDLRLALWERLNHRIGLCLGVFNGVAYLVLISLAIYMISYWTYQTSTNNDPRTIRIVNRMGKDLETTGMSKVAVSVDGTSKNFYEMADIAGMIYQTPLLEARLSRYPAFLALGERPEFQELASDTTFTDLRLQRAPLQAVLDNPTVQKILDNPESLKAIHDALIPNLQDLSAFLATGQSPKYSSEPILGRWSFDVNGAIALVRKDKPNILPKQMAAVKQWLATGFAKTEFVAAPEPERQVFLKNIPHPKITPGAPPTFDMETGKGEWNGADGKYQVTLTENGKQQQMTAVIEGSRLTLTGGEGSGYAFVRED
ncbi:MAG TPA: CvpA family protein [Verrucomicrobiae bacterium]|nr:CvpA family protein [Verrucomicrobiae bacterium]